MLGRVSGVSGCDAGEGGIRVGRVGGGLMRSARQRGQLTNGRYERLNTNFHRIKRNLLLFLRKALFFPSSGDTYLWAFFHVRSRKIDPFRKISYDRHSESAGYHGTNLLPFSPPRACTCSLLWELLPCCSIGSYQLCLWREREQGLG